MNFKVKQAVEKFEKGFNCSQAILSSYCGQFSLDNDTALKIATGFGGGMHINGTCGAVTGAFMVLSLQYGNTSAEDKQSKEKTYEKVVEFSQRFKARNGATKCMELLGCDITTSEGMNKAQENNYFDSICPRLVQDAAEILEEMLKEKD